MSPASSLIRQIILSGKYGETLSNIKKDSEIRRHSVVQGHDYTKTDWIFIFKTACTEIGGGSGRRTDMTFLDFWSTSSALYAPDEGPKDAATVAASFKPSSAS